MKTFTSELAESLDLFGDAAAPGVDPQSPQTLQAAPALAEPPLPCFEVFYSPKKSEATKVSLWLTKKKSDTSSDFDGLIGDKRLWGYIHEGFISFVDLRAPKTASGISPQVAKAEIVVTSTGLAKLVIKMLDAHGLHCQTVWAHISRRAPDSLQVRCGLNLLAQAHRKADAVQQRAEAQNDERILQAAS